MNTTTFSSLSSILCCFGFFFVIIIFFLVTGVKNVPENRRLAVHRLGRYIGDRGPGLVFLIPFIDHGVLIEPTIAKGKDQTED